MMIRKWVGALAVGILLWAVTAPLALAREYGGKGYYIVINKRQQRMHIYRGGHEVLTTVVSTASGKRYFSKRLHRWAHSSTPARSFVVRRKATGWVRSAYGRLYYPLYIDAVGRAIHGSNDLRPRRSHGCIRTHTGVQRKIHRMIPLGTHGRIE